MNKDQVQGKLKDTAGNVQETAGNVQETAGKVIGSDEQQLKGIKKRVDG